MNNDAVELIAAVGPPECIQPFVELARLPSAQQALPLDRRPAGAALRRARRRWCRSSRRCPTTVGYERALLEKYVYKEILAAPGAAKVAEQARQLLVVAELGRAGDRRSRSWARCKQRSTAAEDAKRIRQLAGDRTVLKGWWGRRRTAGEEEEAGSRPSGRSPPRWRADLRP